MGLGPFRVCRFRVAGGPKPRSWNKCLGLRDEELEASQQQSFHKPTVSFTSLIFALPAAASAQGRGPVGIVVSRPGLPKGTATEHSIQYQKSVTAEPLAAHCRPGLRVRRRTACWHRSTLPRQMSTESHTAAITSPCRRPGTGSDNLRTAKRQLLKTPKKCWGTELTQEMPRSTLMMS